MDDKNFKEIKIIIDWSREFFSSQGFCVICGHDDPLDLEFHHLGRKRNDEFVVSLCRNCHGRISRKQRWWPEISLSKNNPPSLKLACVALGLAQVCNEQAQKIFENYGLEFQ